MRGWFRSLGVGTKRNNRPLPKRLLLALSGPRPQHGGTSAVWLNADLYPPSNPYGRQSQFSVVAGPRFGPIFGLLARSGTAFGIGGFEPPQPT